jgi:predicted nucleotidyltransferase
MSILKEFISSLFYIFPSQKRVNRIVLETSSRNLQLCLEKKELIKSDTKIHSELMVDNISGVLLNSNEYKNIKHIVSSIKDSIKKDSISVYLTGSYGSNDYVLKWSDLDIVIVIHSYDKKEIEYIFRVLYNLNKYLYRDDLFQHHGFLMLHSSDFDDETRFFPFEILDRGLCLYGNNLIRFVPTIDNVSFKYMSEFFNKNSFNEINNFFTFKNYIHQITIFPSLYYQSKGMVVYKKKAIEKFTDNFPEFYECFKATSDIRYKWSYLYYLKFIDTNNIIFLRLLRSLLSRLYYKELRELKSEFKVLEQAPQLMETLRNDK